MIDLETIRRLESYLAAGQTRMLPAVEEIREGVLQSEGIQPKPGYTKQQLWALSGALSQMQEFLLFQDVSIGSLAEQLEGNGTVAIFGYGGHLIKSALPSPVQERTRTFQPASQVVLLSSLANGGQGSPALCHPTALPHVVGGVDELLITSPHMSALLLLQSEMLARLAQQVRGRLILPVGVSLWPITIAWESGFRGPESVGEQFLRWCTAPDRQGRLVIQNATSSPLLVELSWHVQTLQPDVAVRIINADGDYVLNVGESQTETCEMALLLQPGRNDLILEFLGPLDAQPKEHPGLLFAVKDLQIALPDGSRLLQGADAYTLDHASPVYLSDEEVRSLLHGAGFFEVEAAFYINQGFYKRALSVSRYLHQAGTYQLGSPSGELLVEAAELGIMQGTVIYVAHRRGRLPTGGQA
ncbi:MAG: hypothetical protein ACOY94_21210 [Bacillota bacterium]